MKSAAIIQAREGSTRLPSKVLLEVEGKTILEWMVDRVRTSKLDDVIIATTHNSPIIQYLCYKKGWNCLAGSEDDVLQRMVDTAQYFNVDIICDITSDCPFICPYQINYFLKLFNLSTTIDYTCNIHPRSWPDGADIQVYKTDILRSINNAISCNSKYREHSGWNILNWHSQESIANLEAPSKYNLPEMRLTLDYPEDFEVIKNIITYFKGAMNFVSIYGIIDYVLDNPDILVNKHLQAKSPGE